MTTISSTSLTQAAEQAAAANAASAAAGGSASASGTASAASTTGANALQQLGSDFNQFLTLLTTQLQNQDPTSPMDSNAFTQELVEFTGVQQSVATNTNLSQLISLQQGSRGAAVRKCRRPSGDGDGNQIACRTAAARSPSTRRPQSRCRSRSSTAPARRCATCR